MATNSPMSNFNRKNPYVIQVKQKYEILMRLYEDVSKSIIVNNIVIAIVLLLQNIMGFGIHKWIFTTCIFTPIMIIMTIIINRFYIKNTIKDSINQEIDKLVTMESNEVIKINIEFVQELLYKVSTCIGKVEAYIKWFKIYTCVVIIIISTISGLGL